MGVFENIPYTNFHDLNLDWILKKMKDLDKRVDNFVKTSIVKYSDPFDWNITTQYPSNTVVGDPTTGIAYISVKPVPENVPITNTDYWTPVFSLQALWDALTNVMESVVPINQKSDTTANQQIEKQELFWLNHKLYITTAQIPLNGDIVIGQNCRAVTIEEMLLQAQIYINDRINTVENNIEKIALYAVPLKNYAAEGDDISNIIPTVAAENPNRAIWVDQPYIIASDLTITNIVLIGAKSVGYNQSSPLLTVNGTINANGCSFTGLTFTGSGNFHVDCSKFVGCYFTNFTSASVFSRCTGASVIDKCTFNGNKNCITYLIDSRVTNSTLNANHSVAIDLETGNNDNIISNNKIEWNEGNGITIFSATHNTIESNIFDRNSGYAIRAAGTTYTTINNNIIRRNGLSTGSNVYLANFVNFNNNIVIKGESTDAGGDLIPNHAITFNNATANMFGNYFDGDFTYEGLNQINNCASNSLIPSNRLAGGNTIGRYSFSINASNIAKDGTAPYQIRLTSSERTAEKTFKRQFTALLTLLYQYGTNLIIVASGLPEGYTPTATLNGDNIDISITGDDIGFAYWLVEQL